MKDNDKDFLISSLEYSLQNVTYCGRGVQSMANSLECFCRTLSVIFYYTVLTYISIVPMNIILQY
jgi:hypothetical protein